MKKLLKQVFILGIVLSACSHQKSEFEIGNSQLSRTVSTDGGKLHTTGLVNKKAGKEIVPANDAEFKLRISQGTQTTGTDVVLTSNDFRVAKVLNDGASELSFLLKNKKHGLEVEVHYELSGDDAFMHKFLKIRSSAPVTLERVDVECISTEDIYQPYQIKQITAQGPAQWKPGLGQPLYTSGSATYWGIEFPAACNFVEDHTGYCGYLWGREIKPGGTYETYRAVVGVGDDANYIQDDFFDYIDRVRIRPLRLQVQYNSWFDYGHGVDKNKFAESVAKIHQELNVKRGVPPLRAYVIDDGWEDVKADWSNKTWKVNKKFDADFATSLANVHAAGSTLGLWMSPGCLFGAQEAAKKYKEQGFETLGKWMSMAGPKYMQLLENRILELTAGGVTYFKLDGIFGHLNTREFELNGQKYGIPSMPQPGTADFSPSDKRLNDAKYDELKTYYLVAGTERLMQIFKKQHEVNPDVYVVISNGAYLSPWWLISIDAVWMINAGDAAKGSDRTQEMVYRDGVYYDTWVKENTQFPINSVFNHEPKKTKTGESAETFRRYLWMNLSRGTGFIELYIKTEKLSESDWDVLAGGLKWAHKVFPYFKHARMHGGDPKNGEVYGYTGWDKNGGYASFHNPSDKKQTYLFVPDRAKGVLPGKRTFTITSPLDNAGELTGKTISAGDTLKLILAPGEVKVLEFKE